uniref:Uncharacterized protein n=1 Tax=Tanacetum cinerariifolium TaxID=118510 RepID=A0A6L2NJJ1_TANCI|nr:hypothetical protein [Tanacetum cinerariifolium]
MGKVVGVVWRWWSGLESRRRGVNVLAGNKDEYSKIISEKNKENEENTEIDKNGSKSLPGDFEIWKGVGTSNRGHVLGAGFTTDPAFVTGTMGSGSIYATHTCSPYEEIRILKKQNDDLKKKMEDAEAQRVADQLVLHQTLNDFAKNYPPRAPKSDPGASQSYLIWH